MANLFGNPYEELGINRDITVRVSTLRHNLKFLQQLQYLIANANRAVSIDGGGFCIVVAVLFGVFGGACLIEKRVRIPVREWVP